MSARALKPQPQHGPETEIAKERACLRCSEPFQSEWAGERICSRCKGTNAWKSGIPRQSAFSTPHR